MPVKFDGVSSLKGKLISTVIEDFVLKNVFEDVDSDLAAKLQKELWSKLKFNTEVCDCEIVDNNITFNISFKEKKKPRVLKVIIMPTGAFDNAAASK